jgi:AcrR family transcriptional regulator
VSDETTRPLTRARIVELALDIIDSDGLEALNMRRLAAASGVRPMSLYHHYPNKQAILDAVGETLSAGSLGETLSAGSLGETLPAAGGRDAVRQLLVGLHLLARSHPRALPLISAAVIRTPSGRRWMNELMRLLLEAGAQPAEAARIYHVLGAYTLGWGYARLLALDVSPGSIIGQLAGHRDEYPHLLQVGMQLAAWEDTDEFEDGLVALLTRVVRLPGWADP